jgi:hypothetical protein
MSASANTYRSRLLYAAITAAVIGIGIASRRFPGLFPAVLGKYPGDALWAMMIFSCLGTVLSHKSARKLGAYALLISFAVEFSQLCQAPWINAIRGTTAGRLILGSTFSWGDLIAYAVGVALSVGADLVLYAFYLSPSTGRHGRPGTSLPSETNPSSRSVRVSIKR